MFYQYFSYETRITIQVNEPSRIDLPGITLCFNLDLHPTLKNLEPWHFLTTTPNMTKQNENCKMFGRVIKNGKDQDNSPVNCRDITGVKVSTIFNNAKCFTYLTQLNISSIQSRKINQMSLDSNIMILFSNETLKQFYPGQIHCGGVKILLNSPYFIPTLRFSDSFDVCTGQTGFIRFTTLFIKSLEWPYKTSCTNYGLSRDSKSVSRRKCFQVSQYKQRGVEADNGQTYRFRGSKYSWIKPKWPDFAKIFIVVSFCIDYSYAGLLHEHQEALLQLSDSLFVRWRTWAWSIDTKWSLLHTTTRNNLPKE